MFRHERIQFLNSMSIYRKCFGSVHNGIEDMLVLVIGFDDIVLPMYGTKFGSKDRGQQEQYSRCNNTIQRPGVLIKVKGGSLMTLGKPARIVYVANLI